MAIITRNTYSKPDFSESLNSNGYDEGVVSIGIFTENPSEAFLLHIDNVGDSKKTIDTLNSYEQYLGHDLKEENIHIEGNLSKENKKIFLEALFNMINDKKLK